MSNSFPLEELYGSEFYRRFPIPNTIINSRKEILRLGCLREIDIYQNIDIATFSERVKKLIEEYPSCRDVLQTHLISMRCLRGIDIKPDVIRFGGCNTKERLKNHWLSNLFYYPFEDFHGKIWGSSEAYFHAQKFVDTEIYEIFRERFRDCPGMVKKLSGKPRRNAAGQRLSFMGIIQEFSLYDTREEKMEKMGEYIAEGNRIIEEILLPMGRVTWRSHNLERGGRISSMVEALVLKFSTPLLRERLLSTGDSYLLEARTDIYWGGGDKNYFGRGLNILGKILMIIRDEIYMNPNRSRREMILSVMARL